MLPHYCGRLCRQSLPAHTSETRSDWPSVGGAASVKVYPNLHSFMRLSQCQQTTPLDLRNYIKQAHVYPSSNFCERSRCEASPANYYHTHVICTHTRTHTPSFTRVPSVCNYRKLVKSMNVGMFSGTQHDTEFELYSVNTEIFAAIV